MKRRVGLLLILLVVLAVAVELCALKRRTPALGAVTVTFLDVGQGDAALIETADRTVLIDGGPDGSVIAGLGAALPPWDRTIDLMVLTHPQADHFGGLIDVIDRYRVGSLITTGVPNTTAEYRAFRTTIEEHVVPERTVVAGTTIVLTDSVNLELLYPEPSDLGADDLNDTSIVARLDTGNIEFLFTGDLGSAGESALIERGLLLESEVLKVGHHGSRFSSTEPFLEMVDPQIATISVGGGNSYGHPHRAAVRRLERAGALVLRTDIEGDITIATDGQRVWREE